MKNLLYKRRIFISIVASLLLFNGSTSHSAESQKNTSPRIVVAGGAITEIIYALGAEETLVGVDTTSQWPKRAQKLPQIGYLRNLSAEGVLSLSPTLLITTLDAGPPTVLEQIRHAGIPILEVPDEKSASGVLMKIDTVAAALDEKKSAKKLRAQVQGEFQKLEKFITQKPDLPRVIFFLNIAQGAPLVSGYNTAADAMINMAGGVNAMHSFEGYKPTGTESIIAAEPDVILIAKHNLEGVDGIAAVLDLPGINLTPAGRNRRVIMVDTLALLGFGPRTGRVALELAKEIFQPIEMASIGNSPSIGNSR